MIMNPIEYIVTGEEMQSFDNNTIEHFKVPGLVLMEQAALACVEEVVKRFPSQKEKVLILSGKGNNGGDAMAVARLLQQKGYFVNVYIVSNRVIAREDFSESAGVQFDILKQMNIPIVTDILSDSYNIIIDGIFGVGLNRKIEGKVAEVIKTANSLHGYKIALDIPSGIHSTTGNLCGVAFRADLTITFAFLKRGFYLSEGAKFVGEVVKKEIGITKESFLGRIPGMFALNGKVNDYIPQRNPLGHKGTFGKVLLVAGSKYMGGAAILAGKAALMCGCGMLRICTHKEHKNELLMTLPEAMIDTYETMSEAVRQLEKGIVWADVIAIGPGIGTDECADLLLKTLIKNSQKPVVIDADGLNLLAKEENYQLLKTYRMSEDTKRQLILTPHPLELSRICRCSKEELVSQGLEISKKLAKELHAVIVKKDARTIVCDGHSPFAINLCGNSGMATAGSGDVLTGITAAMLALGLPVFEAAVTAVYLHGKAGDQAAKNKNEYSMLAGDICNALIEVLR